MNIFIVAGLGLIIGYLIMINVIYFLSPNKKWEEFPKKCSYSTKCTRVADENTRGYGLKPISITENPNTVQEKIVKILNEKTKMTILNDSNGFIHAVDITPFFRFHDDVAIRIFDSEGSTTIWLQSQSRLGIYDLNVNENRIQSLHKKISALN